MNPFIFLLLLFSFITTTHAQPAAVDTFTLTVTTSGNGTVTNLPNIDCGTQCTATYPKDAIVALTATPTDANTNFTGWSGNCAGSSKTTYVVMTSDKTCQAKFAQVPLNTYELTIVNTGQGKVVSNTGNVNCGAACTAQYSQNTQVTLTAQPDADAEFINWEGACVGTTPEVTVIMDEAKACVAKFKRKPLELNITPVGNGVVTSIPAPGINCGATCTALYDVDVEVTLTATPNSDFVFSGWGGDCEGTTNEIKVTMDAAKTCIASFELALTVNTMGEGVVTSTPTGIDCGDTCQANFSANEEVTLTATPQGDSQFTRWEGDCSGTEPQAKVTIDKTKSCTAWFDRYLTIEKTGNGAVTSNPTGIDCGKTCKFSYTIDTEIVLTATAEDGYEFAGWEGDCTGPEEELTIMFDSSKTCQANFALALTIEKNGNGDGTITSEPEGIQCGETCTAPYDTNAQVTLTAQPDTESEFNGWGKECVGTDKEVKVTLDKAKTCQATFATLPPDGFQNLTILTQGTGIGTVTSTPEGIDCGNLCVKPYEKGTSVLLTATPDKDSKFTGWSGDCAGTTNAISAVVKDTSTTLCAATFELVPPTYKLTLETQGGHGTITATPTGDDCGNNCFGFAENTQVTVTVTPQPDSSFLGWSGHCTGTATTTQVMVDKQDKKCTAHLQLKPTFALTITKTGSGAVTANLEGLECNEIQCEGNFYQGAIVTLTAAADPNFKFGIWGGSCISGDPIHPEIINLVMDNLKSCTVAFQPKPTYPLQVERTGEGQGLVTSDPIGISCGEDCQETYYEGALITLTANVQTGSVFTGWTGEGCVIDPQKPAVATVTVNTLRVCKATFELLPPLKLTVLKNGTGTGTLTATPGLGKGIECGSTCEEQYRVGTVVALTVKPDTSSIFTGWRGDCHGTDTTLGLPLTDTHKTCTANFTLLPPAGHYLLTIPEIQSGKVTSTPVGIDCEPTCTAAYANNTIVTLSATPQEGFIFANWTGDCNGIDPLIGVNINTHKTCTPNFFTTPKEGSYLLTILKTGGGLVEGQVVQPVAPPATGTTTTPDGNITGASPAPSTPTPGTDSTPPLDPIDCGDHCSAIYPQDTSLTLTAKPNPDFIFTGWSCLNRGEYTTSPPPSLAPDNPLTITVSNPLVCTAYFDPSPSSLQFAISGIFVNELDGQATLLVTRAASSGGAVSVDYTTQEGTALAGTDYQLTTGTLTWLNGELGHKTITVPIVSDSVAEADKTFTLLLTNPTGKAVITQNTATVTLIDSPPSGAGSLQFSAASYLVEEASRQALIGVDRLGGSTGAVSVSYTTSDDQATVGSDYTATQGVLNWVNGEMSTQFFTIPILTDAISEGPEKVHLTLSSPVGGANLGALRNATLTIVDNLSSLDPSLSSGILQFTQANYPANEGSNVTLIVSRRYGMQGDVSVSYTTQPETAQPGSDYTPPTSSVTPGTVLTWPAGDVTDKNIVIPLLNDNTKETEETFRVNLTSPTGEASLGAISSATVTLLDSLGTPSTTGPTGPAAGIIQLVANNYQVPESGGSITLTVSRVGGTLGVVEVEYETQDGTAKTSRDYLGVQDQLRWLDGDSTDKKIDIGILDNGLPEADKTFTLRLYSLLGDAVLGSNAETVVTIADDDSTNLQFSSGTYTVNEDGNLVTLTVTREGGNIGQVSVQYNTADGTAIAGSDYSAFSGWLTWVSGDTRPQMLTIPVREDKDLEGNENFLVKLTTIEGQATFGKLTEANVTLIDNELGECKLPVIDCFYNNDGETLQDVKVTKQGTLSGGTLGGDILNEGVIQDVTMLPKTRVSGGLERGIVRGRITSDPAQRAVLTELDIAPDTTLSNIIIGRRVQMDNSVTLQEGVCFEDNTTIPSVDLVGILGRLTTPYLDFNAVRLIDDVLCLSAVGGIVGAINGLDELQQWVLTQNPVNGYLQLRAGDLLYTVLPIETYQILRKQVERWLIQGLFVSPNGSITFVTHTSREIHALPVVQDPLALQTTLDAFDLRPMTMQANGNLKIPLAGGAYYSARPDLFSAPVGEEIPLGLDGMDSPWIDNIAVFFLVFNDGTVKRKQFMYPAAADPEALYALSATHQTVLELDGRVSVQMGTGAETRYYQGLLDYAVTSGTPVEEANIELLDDLNEDGLADYQIVYPNGDRQVLYQLPVE